METTGDHRGQFPTTDFGLAHRIFSSNNTARTPKAKLVRGKAAFPEIIRRIVGSRRPDFSNDFFGFTAGDGRGGRVRRHGAAGKRRRAVAKVCAHHMFIRGTPSAADPFIAGKNTRRNIAHMDERMETLRR